MMNKPFTLNTKRLTLMTASAALVLSLASPMVFADHGGEHDADGNPIVEPVVPADPPVDEPTESVEEPPVDAPMDDSGEVIVPFDPEDPTAGLDEPLPPDETVVDTGTEPAPTPVPEVEPEPAAEPEIPVVDSGDMNPDSPVRVIVQFVDEDGSEIASPVNLKGDVGMAYRALNIQIPGYELSGPPEGEDVGVFTASTSTVTYTYLNLAVAAPVPDAEALPPVELPVDDEVTPAPVDPPMDDNDEVLVPITPPTGDVTTPVAPTPVDPPMDDNDEVIVPITPPTGNVTTPAEPSKTDGTDSGRGRDDDAMDDSDEVLVDKDGNVLGGQDESAVDADKDAAAALNKKDGTDAESGELKAIPQASAETNWFTVAMGLMATAGAAVMLHMRRLKPGIKPE